LVEITVEATGELIAPTGAGQRPDSGSLDVVSTLILGPEGQDAAEQIFGGIVFNPSNQFGPILDAFGDFDPSLPSDTGDEDIVLNFDDEVVFYDIRDKIEVLLPTNTPITLDASWRSNILGELFQDEFESGGSTQWASVSDSTLGITIRSLDPGARIREVPEPGVGLMVLAGLALARRRR